MKNELKIAQNDKIWFSIIALLTIISLGSLIFLRLNFGIDFVGGTIITIDLHKTFETNEVRDITNKYDSNATITYSGDNAETVVISTSKDLSTDQRQELFNAFKDKYSLKDSDLISVDTISPAVGSEMTRNALLAVAVAVLLMLIYITFRFQVYYGIAAILSLIFDILVVIGCYSLFRIQVNTPFIAAILTILGYGINDTIVVFDRIRENLELSPNANIDTVINTSARETIKRSLYTSITTLLAIGAIYIFGVEDIKDFALPIIIGIVISTYASICVATPIWQVLQTKNPLHIGEKRKRKKAQKA